MSICDFVFLVIVIYAEECYSKRCVNVAEDLLKMEWGKANEKDGRVCA